MNQLEPLNYDRHRDFLGTRINPGQTVVYPGRVGSSLWMNEAKVLKLDFRSGWAREPKPVIQVQRLHSKTGEKLGRPVVLSELDRVVVLGRG